MSFDNPQIFRQNSENKSKYSNTNSIFPLDETTINRTHNNISNLNYTIDEKNFDSNTSIRPKNKNWLHPQTDTITLIKVIDQSFYEGHLVLSNITDKFIVFKFKSEKQCYSITPILYFIHPNETITINIKRFERLDLSSQVKINDYVQIIAAQADKTIEDVNDAKIYLRKEDIYSPEYQVYKLPIDLDNGNNLFTYQKVIQERKTILNEYNKQLNMNNVTSCEEVKKYIDNIKKEIKDYEDKINEIMSKLGDMNKNNIIKQPEAIFNIETYNAVYRKKANAFNQDAVPVSVFIFLICISLFIGKFIAFMSN